MRMGADRVAAALDAEGERRFAAKAARFAEDISKHGVEQTLYERLIEAFGYGGNGPPMLALGRLLPWGALSARARAAADPASTMEALLLGAAGLLDGFADVIGADQVAHSKPAPDLLLLALERLKLPPGEALMVGDSRYDRGAAEAARVPFVGLGLDGDFRIEQLGALVRLPPFGAR